MRIFSYFSESGGKRNFACEGEPKVNVCNVSRFDVCAEMEVTDAMIAIAVMIGMMILFMTDGIDL